MTRRNKTGNAKAPRLIPFRVAVASGVFAATILLALLSFVSLELAALAFSIMAVTALLYAGHRTRNFRELATAFKFKSLRDGQSALREELHKNTRGLAAIKDDLEEIKARLARMKQAAPTQNRKKEESKPLPAALPPDFYDLAGKAAAGTKPALRNQPYTPKPAAPAMPRALRPGQNAPQPEEIVSHNSSAIARPDEDEPFSDTIVRELLRHAVTSRRVEVFVQPVVRLPQRQVRFYEIYARIRARPGQYIPAARYMKLAEQDNLSHEIDVLLLLHCLKTLQESAHIERAAPFFLNITRETLGNGQFMKQLLGFISRNRSLAPRMIFEIPLAQFSGLPASLLEIVRGLGRLGCSFSLDNADQLDLDIAELQNLKIRFVKIDSARLLAARSNERDMMSMNRARRRLEANGIGVIAQRIEDERQLRQLLDFDVHYGQGYLFGKPEPQGAYADRTRARRKGLTEEDQKRA